MATKGDWKELYLYSRVLPEAEKTKIDVQVMQGPGGIIDLWVILSTQGHTRRFGLIPVEADLLLEALQDIHEHAEIPELSQKRPRLALPKE